MGFGALGLLKPYEFIVFGDIHGLKAYEFIGSRATWYFAQTAWVASRECLLEGFRQDVGGWGTDNIQLPSPNDA